jgi:hypothetical protein
MDVDGVQHGYAAYACRLRQLPPVTGEFEWTADALTVSTGCAKQNNDGHMPLLLYAGGTLRCVLYLSLEVLRPLFTGVTGRMLCRIPNALELETMDK